MPLEEDLTMNNYLQETAVVDFNHPAVMAKSRELANSCSDSNNTEQVARACFEWVRDQIQHSGDIKEAGYACSASEVLESGNGWCFGKSHLLVALLRANGIPSAFCYQRVKKDDKEGFTLHGLNSIFLPKHGWYRVDPRGNKDGVDAQFTPPYEQLAWSTDSDGELDFTERFAEPLNVVCDWIQANESHQQALDSLPDAKELVP